MINNILYLLSKIPDVVWSGIVASLLTLGGVMLSNHSNTKRLKIQLKHDSQEKSKERQANLRHEVYLQAAEETAKVGSYLGTLPQLDPVKINLADGLNGFLHIAAKLQLIASPETADLVGELTMRYAEVFFKLVAKAQPMHDIKIDIDICNDFYERNSAEVNRILASMTQYSESRTNEPLTYAALQRSFDNFQKSASEYADQRGIHWNNYNLLNKQYAVTLINEMKDISELQIRVTAAIRKELELETNSEEMMDKLEKNRAKMQNQLDSFLKEIEKV